MNWDRSDGFEEWPGCLGCAHLRRGKRPHCSAYPDGIPLIIVSGEVDHLIQRPGQRDATVYEPMDLQHWLATKERRVLSEVAERAATP